MLMKQNVNNDVTKDSPIAVYVLRHYQKKVRRSFDFPLCSLSVSLMKRQM